MAVSIESELATIVSMVRVTLVRKRNGTWTCILTPSHLDFAWAPNGAGANAVDAIRDAKKYAADHKIKLS